MEELLEVTNHPPIEAEAKRDLICEAADEIKAQEIVVLDVRGLTTLADYFVMCSGTSTTHIQSIAQGVRDRLRERAGERAKPEGDSASLWIIMDYGDVILHIFDQETREFYDLERLWADAKVSSYEPKPQTDNSNEGRESDNTATGRLDRLRPDSRVQ
ncbi:MAG TPA: ribosome silencing factor [Abditibacteriaceae bacterium]|jgi:ribosome-associated protein